MIIILHASTVLPSLADLGKRLDALTVEYDAAATVCSALIAESEKTLSDAGIAYGSTEWSCQRFAKCGAAIRKADALQMDVEELALIMTRHPVASLEDLALKAKAHLSLGAPNAILADIAALRQRESATA
ncbi:hypothetical protein C8J35_103503 [Rhizobium sp. PP-F2F-G38]|nr:hypothetical protein C8J35_103503 [Rhizobium sp. PP-F2F-G38]